MGRIANLVTQRPNTFIAVVCALEGLRAIYSSFFYQEADWPCYYSFGSRLLSGDFDYSHYLCRWGYMYYPPTFAYLYAVLAFVTRGSVPAILAIHVLLSMLNTFLALKLSLPLFTSKWMRGSSPANAVMYIFMTILPESIYRAGISRVTNDSWQVLTLLLMMHCLVRRKFAVASVLLSVAISLKMNAMFYVPSLVFIIWHVATLRRVLSCVCAVALSQLLPALPFLLVNSKAFFSIAFNFSRDFENHVNLAWGFLGDELRLTKPFYTFLLVSTVLVAGTAFVLLSIGWYRISRRREFVSKAGLTSPVKLTPYSLVRFVLRTRDYSTTSEPQELAEIDWKFWIVLTMVLPNFLCYMFSRGAYIQYFLWIAWTLPYLLLVVGKWRWPVATCLFWLFDWCHCHVWNAVRLNDSLHFIDWLEAYERLELEDVDQAYRMVGYWYPESYSLVTIPASFILWCAEVYIACVLLRSVYRISVANEKHE